MPLYTSNFRWAYFTANDRYAPELEAQRWISLDTNLGASMRLVGDGVISGWTISGTAGATSFSVASGSGVVGGLYARTTSTTTVSLSALAPSTTYNLYAFKTSTTHYAFDVDFLMSEEPEALPTGAVLLGQVTTDGSGTLDLLDDNRTLIGLTESVLDAIADHVHSGTGGSPSKINLATEVQGVLPAANIGTLPASKISGNIPASVIRGFSHTQLEDIGALTHEQIDDFVDTIDDPKFQHLGLVNAINILQSAIISTHYVGTAAMQYMANIRGYIPGITPDSWVDETNSTVTIDKVNNYFEGTHGALIDPPIDVINTIDKAEGIGGFSGPANLEDENLVIEESGNENPNIELKKLYTTRYYHQDGEFYVDFNAGSVVSWYNLSWNMALLGGSTLPIGTQGLEVNVAARTAISRKGLETGAWVTLGTSEESSKSLEGLLQNGRWIRVRGQLSRGYTLSTLSPVFTGMELQYNVGSEAKCAFLFYPDMDSWEDDRIGYNLITIQDGTEHISLLRGSRYASQAVFDSPVLDGGPNLVEWGRLTPTYTLPGPDTSIEFKIRSSATLFAGTAATAPPWRNYTWYDQIAIGSGGTGLGEEPYKLSDRYLQFRVVLKQDGANAAIQNTPEILHAGVSFFEQETPRSEALAASQSVALGDDGILTVVTDSDHSFAPGIPVRITGNSHPGTFADFVFRPTLAYGTTLQAGGYPTGAATFGDGGYIQPLQQRCKEWHRSGQDANGWAEVAGSQSFQSALLTNLSTGAFYGGVTPLDSTQQAKWVSPAYRVPDTKFRAWDFVEVFGENLGVVTIEVQGSDDPNADAWETLGTLTEADAVSPLRVPLGFTTKAWVRIIVTFPPR